VVLEYSVKAVLQLGLTAFSRTTDSGYKTVQLVQSFYCN